MNSVKKLNTLYGIDKSGKIKEWNISVSDLGSHSEILYSYGYTDGKATEYKYIVTNGKNIGKKNETTHFQQALSEALSKWNKKKDINGYMEKLELDKDIVYLPMLAQEFNKHSHKLKFPCYVQPKLDGYRMLYNPHTAKMTTRTGKEYTILHNTDMHKQLIQLNMHTDGEFYVHDSTFKFENYGILRKHKVSTDMERKMLNTIEYHIYDIVDSKLTFAERTNSIFNNITQTSNIKLVPTYLCENKSDIDKWHDKFIDMGYEGSILRNSDGKYMCKYRSYDLLKRKNVDDGEYIIVDYTYETDVSGDNNYLIIWICKTADGKLFNVPSKGTRKERTELYKTANKYIGKQLSVQHFGFTAENVPRFPKSLRNGKDSIRDEIV